MQIPPPADATGPSDPPERSVPAPSKTATPTQFFLKGLAISLPPILTLVILVWIGQLLYGYVVSPITTGVRFVIAEVIDKSRPTAEFAPATGLPPLEYCGTDYRVPKDVAAEVRRRTDAARRDAPRAEPAAPLNPAAEFHLESSAYVPFGERAVPYGDFEQVASRKRPVEWPATTTGLYMELATIRYFKSLGSLSALAVALSIVGLYFLGRFVTARMGQWVISRFETLVLARVPIISSVYSSVKQVTDFFFSERAPAYNRVVAFEFPRRGIWTIGFAMGESPVEMTLAAAEPMISVMVPAAPMPMTGWVVSVPKSAVIDLDITLDQAFQYFLSCGVLVPEHQRATPEILHREIARRLSGAFGPGAGLGRPTTMRPGDHSPPIGPSNEDRSDAPGRFSPPEAGGAPLDRGTPT